MSRCRKAFNLKSHEVSDLCHHPSSNREGSKSERAQSAPPPGLIGLSLLAAQKSKQIQMVWCNKARSFSLLFLLEGSQSSIFPALPSSKGSSCMFVLCSAWRSGAPLWSTEKRFLIKLDKNLELHCCLYSCYIGM